MDPTDFLFHAAFLNDKGFALMQSGQQHEAFETFLAGLEHITTMSQIVDARRQQQHRTFALLPSRRRKIQQSAAIHQSSLMTTFTSTCEEASRLKETCSLCNNSASVGDQQSNFVCNHVFRFALNRDLSKMMAGFDIETLTHYMNLYRAVLTFNSALSFHQRSLGANESVKPTAERVAADLYLDALDLLRECFTSLDSCRLLAATLNNAAVMFYELKDFEKFEVFQAELHRLLIDMEIRYPRVVDPRYIQGLFFNATLLAAPSSAAAA